MSISLGFTYLYKIPAKIEWKPTKNEIMYEIISKKKTKVIIGLIRIPKLIKFIEIHITATIFFCEFFFF